MNLDHLLKPRSIAVLGASNNPNSIGGRPIRFLKEYGFDGGIYPVNPKYQTLQELPCYKSLQDLPEPVDLLLIAIRAEFVEKAVNEATTCGVKSIMIISSGFGEVGGEGQVMQDRIAARASNASVAIMGPNCQGFIDHWGQVPVTFTGALVRGTFNKGPIAFVSQSGAMGYHFYGMAQNMGIGFSYMISSGNEAMVSASDYLQYVLHDENTRVAAAYMEGLNDPKQLQQCARLAIEKEKPLLVMKVGRSASGSQAASSHTGSMAGEDRLVDAFFQQEGILRVDQVEQFFDLFKVFGCQKRLNGDRIAIVSISGGAGVVMADNCETFGMQMARFSGETEANLADLLPSFGSARNPVDLTAQVLTKSEDFQSCIQSVVNDENVDGVVVFIGLLEHMKDILIPPIETIANRTEKPILVTWMACDDPIRKDFQSKGIPLYEEPGRCLYAMGMLNRYRLAIQRQHERQSSAVEINDKQVVELPSVMASVPSGCLDEYRSKEILRHFKIPVTREVLATSASQAVDAASEIGFPVVLKVVSAGVPHKSDAGGVVLNVTDADGAAGAYEQIMKNVAAHQPKASVQGVLVSEMVDANVELLVGLKNDPVFGPAIMVGLGGIFVEVFKDVSTRILPITPYDARSMLSELKGYPLLTGARGKQSKDVDAVIQTLLNVSQMGIALGPRLAEMDINPLMVLDQGKGVKAADALFTLRA